MKHTSDREIGRRAAEEMLRVNSSIIAETKRIGICRGNFYNWQRGESCPDARALQAMAEAGYDVNFILTGRRRDRP